MYDLKGKEVGEFKLPSDIFTGEANQEVLYQAILMYNANSRQGTASTKTRTEVSGGGKKPWRQKGTGRARAGSTRSPLWRGGGIVFGPHPRDFHYRLPKKITRRALLSALNTKLRENRLIGIGSITLDEPKTKHFSAIIKALKLEGRSLFVLDSVSENIKKASRNIPDVCVKTYQDINMLDVLASNTVVMSKASLENMPKRFAE